VSAELADEAADASASGPRLSGVCRRGGPELLLEVTVAESINEVAAGQDGVEQLGVLAGDGVETREALTKLDARAAE